MTAKERLELSALRERWKDGSPSSNGALSSEERRRAVQLEELERAEAWRVKPRKKGVLWPFFHFRYLGDPRPLDGGLPVCAAPTCRRTFTPTSPGQELCHACLDAQPKQGAQAPVVDIRRVKG